MLRKRIYVFFWVGLALTACGRDTHNHAKDITNKQLFEEHCASCHGVGASGSIMLSAPANKDTALLNFQIRKKIIEGSGADSKMPKFPNMPTIEANRIIHYLRTLPKTEVDE